MIPNILTLLALCAGMTAIRFAINGRFMSAVLAILVAAILDGLDGRVARLLKTTSSLGAQLDSLSDFICFGVAPAIILYIWTMSQLQAFGWVVVLLYGVCCALRLARFNTQLGAELPPYAYSFFTGIPSPAAAGLVLMPIYATLEWGGTLFRSPYLNAVVILSVAALMVSRVPTYSFKRSRVPAHYALPVLVLVGVLAALLTTEPWGTMAGIAIAYLLTIPFSIRSYQKLRAHALRQQAAETAAQDEGARA